jgi:hypothetical protein
MQIQKAVWPERSCREPVWGRYMSYACELPDLHRGPCVSLSVQDSVQRREVWEDQENPQEAPSGPETPQEATAP